MKPIVLASASPRRKALLNAIGIHVEVQPSNADEIFDGDPETVVFHNSRMKRDDVAAALKQEALVIAADTIVFLEGEILGKPADLDEARRMLKRLSGQTHAVYTGVAVVDMDSGKTAEGVERTEVTFKPLDENEIDSFVEIVNPLDRAGAYTTDGPGSLLVAQYNGCYQNVLGLPIVRLETLLRELGDSLLHRIEAERAMFL